MKKTVYYLVFLMLITFAGCNNNTSTTIKIGASLPLTGDFASYGKRARNGIDLAVSEINISKKYTDKIEIVYQDNKGGPKESVNIMNMFATINKYPIVIGGASSMETLAMLPIANVNDVVLISPISSSPDLSMNDNFFRVCPSDAYQAVMMANWLKELKLSNVALLYVNSNWGVSLKNQYIKNFEANGGKISIIESMNEGERDFKTQISKIIKANPEAIYCVSYGAEGGIILKQLKEFGYKKQIFGADVWSSPELLKSAGDAAEGVYLIKPAEYTGNRFVEFEKKYKAKYKENPDVYAAYSYDVAYIIAEALSNTDGSGKEVKRYLLKMNGFDGATGITKFDALGDCNTKQFVRLQIRNGIYKKL